jgi:hypothetical protein
LHTAVWGAANAVSTNNPAYTQNPNGAAPNTAAVSGVNALQVSEAWLWWKMSDMASLRSGRQGIDYGDGLSFSKNDWLATPYNADAIMARMSWDFMDLDVGGGTLGNGGFAAGASQTDTQVVFYGLYASMKSLPDVLKHADLFVLQANEDAGVGASVFTPSVAGPGAGGSFGLTTIGIHAKGEFSIVDYRLDFNYQTGAQKNVVAAGGQTVNYTADMIDTQVGVNFPEFMKGRFYVGYHTDTGDNSSTSAGSTSQHQYQPLFYDRHQYAGQMDAIGFGNLTYIRLGVTGSPTEDTSVGLAADLLSRSSTSSGTASSATVWLQPTEGNLFGTAPASVNGTSSDLGTQYKLWANHNYGHGFSMMGSLAYWSMGQYFKPAGNNVGSPIQFLAQAKYAF